MGSLLILIFMISSMFLFIDLTHVFTLILFLTTISLGLLGAIDDYLKIKRKNTKGLSGKKKLFFQFVCSGLLALYLFNPAVTAKVQIGKWFSPPVIKEHLSTHAKSDELLAATTVLTLQ